MGWWSPTKKKQTDENTEKEHRDRQHRQETQTRNTDRKHKEKKTQRDFFSLCCRIALDSCGQIVARSQKEIKSQLTHGDQQETTQPTPKNQGKGELK